MPAFMQEYIQQTVEMIILIQDGNSVVPVLEQEKIQEDFILTKITKITKIFAVGGSVYCLCRTRNSTMKQNSSEFYMNKILCGWYLRKSLS